jgi:hypothetical protein
MGSLKDEAKAYEPKQTLNIADLDTVSVDVDLKEAEGINEKGEAYTYKYAEINGEQYRVPKSVLESLKEIIALKPDVTQVKVEKTGSGMATRYKVRVL